MPEQDQPQEDTTLSEADKQTLREQAAETNSVPQFPDELDAQAKEADDEARQAQQ